MPKKSESIKSSPKEIKGNRTVIRPGEKPISQYAASTVTSYEKNEEAPPDMRDCDVSSARNFVMDNKK